MYFTYMPAQQGNNCGNSIEIGKKQTKRVLAMQYFLNVDIFLQSSTLRCQF